MDKLNLAAYVESSTVALTKAQAALAMVKDDGLKKLVEGSISAGEAQIKSIQEFVKSHNLS